MWRISETWSTLHPRHRKIDTLGEKTNKEKPTMQSGYPEEWLVFCFNSFL